LNLLHCSPFWTLFAQFLIFSNLRFFPSVHCAHMPKPDNISTVAVFIVHTCTNLITLALWQYSLCTHAQT
jgi:hypothetical protein